MPVLQAQDRAVNPAAFLEHLRRVPSDQTFYAFRLSDGKEPWVAARLRELQGEGAVVARVLG